MTVRELFFNIGYKTDKKSLKDAESKVQNFKKNVGNTIKNVGLAVGAAVIGIGAAAIKSAGDMEMLTTQFEVMLGSSEKAQAMMENLKEFAASTPFQLPDLAKGTQNLISFGVAENDVINTMKMLGDTAGGNTEKLNGLIGAYGKVQVNGKASLEELKMMGERGLPIFEELKNITGKQGDEFINMISKGGISASMVTEAFRRMTSEGGMFFKGLEKASQTFLGLMSTLKDNINLVLGEVGLALLPDLKKIIDQLITMVKTTLMPLAKSIVSSLTPIITNAMKLVEPVLNFITMMFDSLKPVLDEILKAFNPLLSIVNSLMNLLQPLLSMGSSFLLSIVKVLNDFLTIISEILVIFEPLNKLLLSGSFKLLLWSLLPIIVSLQILAKIILWLLRLLKPLQGFLKLIFEPLNKILLNIENNFMKLLKRVGEFIKKIGLLKTLFTTLKTVIKLVLLPITTTINALKWVFSLVFNQISDIISKSETLRKIFNKISEIFTGIKNTFTNILNDIGKNFVKVVNYIIDKINYVINGLNTVLEKIPGVGKESIAKLTRLTPNEKLIQDNTNNTNNNQKNQNNNIEINFDVTGGGGGLNSVENQKKIADTTRSIFQIELKKILVSAGY